MTRKKGNTFGERVRSLRVDRGISLEELSRQTGYPADFIARVEEGGVAPPVALVLQLGRAFKVDIEQLEDRRSREATKRRSQSHKKRVASYAYTALTRGGTENHLRAYLVTLDPETDHRGVEYHHEGEEFIYVLKGSVSIKVGENVSRLDGGESIHFNSSIHHALSNPSSGRTELLVVVYVP